MRLAISREGDNPLQENGIRSRHVRPSGLSGRARRRLAWCGSATRRSDPTSTIRTCPLTSLAAIPPSGVPPLPKSVRVGSTPAAYANPNNRIGHKPAACHQGDDFGQHCRGEAAAEDTHATGPIFRQAEKVETAEEFRFCTSIGFEYFQGFYFAPPTIVSGSKPRPPGHVLRSLPNLLRADAPPEKIATAVKNDYSLSRYSLQLARSDLRDAPTSHTQTVSQSLRIVGRSKLRH